MSTCRACGADCRKTVLATVFGGAIGMVRGRVCQKCAARGLLIVSVIIPPRVIEKVERPELVAKALRMLTTYAAAAKAEGLHERAEGLECAIETLKRAS